MTTDNVYQLKPEACHFKDLDERGISGQAAAKYGIWSTDKQYVFPYFSASGEHLANKIRPLQGKAFFWEGNESGSVLFGQQAFPPKSFKTITLVEGEFDATATYEMFGCRYPVVSVKSANRAPKDVAENFEYLNSFDEIVVCFDRDEPHKKPDGSVWFPGQEAAAKVASMFQLGKVRLLSLQKHKDANDYLKAGDREAFVSEWWKAPNWTPAGLKIAKDMWEEVRSKDNYKSIPYPWQGLQEKTYGIRKSEAVLINAQPGVGKTSLCKELEFHILRSDSEARVGFLHIEERNKDTLLGIMSLEANRPLYLPDVRDEFTDEQLKGVWDRVATDRMVLWDHFGSNSIDEVLAKIRHMHNLGCDYIFLDHLSIIVSDQSGDERKQLDEISTKLKTLCMELNIAVIAVVHQNRKGEVRGSAGPEELANIILRLERDVESEDEFKRNVLRISIPKNRFCGRTGLACLLKYDEKDGHLHELAGPDVDRYTSDEPTKPFGAW